MAVRYLTKPGGGGGAGLSAINISAGTTSNNLSAVTFANSNGVSFGLNGSVVTGSVVPDVTYKQWDPYWDRELIVTNQGQGTLAIEPVWLPNVAFDRLCSRVMYSNASGSTGSITASNWFAVYTSNVSTLSLLSSTSFTVALTFSGTDASFSLFSGVRNWTQGWTGSFSAGDYWVGVLNRTTSGGANASWNQLCVSMMASAYVGLFGVAPNSTLQRLMGQGSYTATTAGLPDSIAFSQIHGSGTLPQRAPAWFLVSGTV